jgi:hypothetical protein
MQISELQIFVETLARYITVNEGAGGSVSPGSGYVPNGGSKTWTITPSAGYIIASITYGGSPQTITDPSGMDFTDSSVTADATLAVTFAQEVDDERSSEIEGFQTTPSERDSQLLPTLGKISGYVLDGESPVENAIVTLIDSDTDTVVGTTNSDYDGYYEFTDLPYKQYHALAEYESGEEQLNAKSLPFLRPVTQEEYGDMS